MRVILPKFPPELVKAHKNYVDAINSNDTRRVMKMYDAGAVVMQPDGPLVQGRKDLEAWVRGYFHDFKTHWVKKSLVMWMAGDYGFDQGIDHAVDLPIERDKKGKVVGYGKPVRQVVKGILVYKRQRDGAWLVYRDIWNYNTPPVITR